MRVIVLVSLLNNYAVQITNPFLMQVGVTVFITIAWVAVVTRRAHRLVGNAAAAQMKANRT